MPASGTSLLIHSTGNDSKASSSGKSCTRRRKSVYILALWALLASAIFLTAAFAIGGLPISLDSPDETYDGVFEITESIDYSHMNSIHSRKKREAVEKLKEENEQAIMKLMEEPNCKEDCKRLQKQLANLDATIEAAQSQLSSLKAEIAKVSKGCLNRTSLDDDSSEVQLRLSPLGSGVLEDLSGRHHDDVVDHDLAASENIETRYPWPWAPDPAYPWPPASELRNTIPPTGPDSSVIGEPTATGPGETVQTSQQMTVSLPKNLQRLCTLVPGPPGSSGYVCTPVDNLLPQSHPSNGNFYLQVVGRSQTHVPTAISTPNPFAFPTLSGSPVIVPASAAPSGKLVPVYSPGSGQIYMQNYQQNSPSMSYIDPNHQQQFLVPVSQQPQVVPFQQYAVPQYMPPLYQPAPAFRPQYTSPIPMRPVFFQQQYAPAVYQPQAYVPQSPLPNSQFLGDSVLQCSYVIVPNTPVHTYKFPAVSGVSEVIQRAQSTKPHSHHPKKNSTKPKMNEFSNCPPGSIPCEDESTCVPEDEWCDSKIDCLDFSDENKCGCKQRILQEKACDGYFDCPRGEDELGCFGCKEEMFSCDDFNEDGDTMTCLPIIKRCDSYNDCPNGKDEVGCTLITDEYNFNQEPVVSFTNGFLFKNWKGLWYPVCTSVTWHTDSCREELHHLSRYPDVKYELLKGYNSLFAKQIGNGVELAASCLGSPPGTALWVDCPPPECGIKPVNHNILRKKRDFPNIKQEQWVDHYPHSEDPSFHTTPEAIRFVKNFFNSVSIFDKKKFYKRMWGPLVQPFMGIKDTTKTNKDEEDTLIQSDPTQSSWQYYLHPHEDNFNDYNTRNFFQDYQTQPFNGRTQPYNVDPNSPYNYYDQFGHYFINYPGPFSQSYVRSQRHIHGDEMLRVVGGSRSEPGAWPWLVILYRNGIFHCGGSILTTTIILTAAHCAKDFENDYYEVQAGVLRRFSFSPQEQIRRVSQVIVHEEYDGSTMMNDIALMKLSSPLKYNRWVLPICLPPRQPPFQPLLPLSGTICTAIGWGALFEHGPDPDHLHEVDIPILPNCLHHPDRIGNEICAGYPGGGMDTCQGDSGGPLLCRLTEEKWYIAGIVSHGEGCARLGEAGVYTRVSMFIEWIQNHLAWPDSTSKTSRKKCPGPMCETGRCLPYGTLCDSHIDCLTGEDEFQCGLLSDPLPHERTNEDEILNSTSSESYETPTTPAGTVCITEERLDSSTEGRQNTTINEESTATEEEISSTGFQPTTEEPIIHSEQTHSVDISQLFICNKLNQRIISSRVCDKIIDCEDGSDEAGCTCKDYLKHTSSNLICDGQIDCRDSSDEKECPEKCEKHEFYCYKSNNCIPKEQQCNLDKDCYFGEDEKDCYALIEDELQLDELGRPKLLMKGTAVRFSNGTWKDVCNDKNSFATAMHICNHLGFSIAKKVEGSLQDKPLLEVGKDGICNRLVVSCSSPSSRMWLAPLYASGSPLTLAALISNQWLLAPIVGLQLPSSNIYLNTWLGKRNLSLEIEGPYDQYIKIDGLTTVGQAGVTLLHLEKAASINHMTVPLTFPEWPTPVNEKEECWAVGMRKVAEGEIVSVKLKPATCREGYRCYVLSDDNPPVCEIIGLVECHSSYGSYISAVIADNICSDSLIELYDLTRDRNQFTEKIEKNSYESLEEDLCESVRCESGKCLSWDKIGDVIPDCFDSRDEENEIWTKKEKHCQENKDECVFDCHPGEIKCQSGECLNASRFCDGESHCSDGSDEKSCDCAGYISLAHPMHLCDGIVNCFDKGDENWERCINKTDCSSSNQFKCHLSGGCVPTAFICDGDEDCPNGEDEISCIAIRSPTDRPEEGLIYSRLYGELVPQCLEPSSNLAETICLRRGWNKLKTFHSTQVPYLYVQTDAFSKVRLNKNTALSLRPHRQFASLGQDHNKNCTGLYVICDN